MYIDGEFKEFGLIKAWLNQHMNKLGGSKIIF